MCLCANFANDADLLCAARFPGVRKVAIMPDLSGTAWFLIFIKIKREILRNARLFSNWD